MKAEAEKSILFVPLGWNVRVLVAAQLCMVDASTSIVVQDFGEKWTLFE